MAQPSRTTASIILPRTMRDLSRIIDSLNILARGGGANWKRVPLDAGMTSTTVPLLGLSANAIVFVQAQDADSQAVSPEIGSISPGELVINHGASATPGVVGVMYRQ